MDMDFSLEGGNDLNLALGDKGVLPEVDFVPESDCNEEGDDSSLGLETGFSFKGEKDLNLDLGGMGVSPEDDLTGECEETN
jgi:hypothetical protein